ncbi:hypothetical protein OBBRIDRAFT_789060 [Obba rivulosa]|uniref:Uncharacterized protein n=1 Tax=Obba rivulosa TaxID=1052685 RepID=A0A8E2J4R9_9APHY|nr:hypothetical protein OBBRIDRAFT_789060 [Obba rivulosa]
MPTAPTPPGRLRSKTSDLSDLLRSHGARSDRRNSESQRHPPTQQTTQTTSHHSEPTTPSKGKRKIAIFGRRRKSESVSPSLSASDYRVVEEEIPPLPPLDSRISTGDCGQPSSRLTSESSRIRPPSQVSLPPALSLPKPQGRLSSSQPHEQQRPHAASVSVTRSHQLRGQKSTSFEYTRQSVDRQAEVSGNGRPMITISAPPVADHASASQRSVPVPAPIHTGRRFGLARFGTRREQPKPPDSPPSPTSPTSPRSPTSIKQFPSSAAVDYQSHRTSVIQSGIPRAEDAPKKSISKGRSFLPGSRSPPPDKPRKSASALPLSSSRQAQLSGPTLSVKRSISESSASPSQDATDGAAAARATSPPSRSRIPGSSSLRSPGTKAPPPLLPTWRRPLSGGPPLEPLPSPPHSATTIRAGGNETKSTQSSSATSTPTNASFPGVGPRPSMAWIHQQVFGQTIENVVPSASTHSLALEAARHLNEPLPSSTESLDRDREAVRFLVPETPTLAEHEHPISHDAATAEQLREALNAQSARYARLAAYVPSLIEKHAAEKSELKRRIEVLEQEAHKREREIKGLRWLVMNANPTPPASSGRQPGFSQVERGQDAIKPGPQPAQHVAPTVLMESGHAGTLSIDSLSGGSMEEGLFELQATVSDLIAPLSTPPSTEMSRSRDRRSSRARLRRSNTISYELNQDASILAAQKQARRTSSPVLPPPGGTQSMFSFKGSPSIKTSPAISASNPSFELESIPTIPSFGSEQRISPIPSIASPSFSLPSLTATNTASSGLSAIPELPKSPAGTVSAESSDYEPIVPAAECPTTGEEQHVPHPRKHVATISTSSTSASTAYADNLKMGAAPSIGQVLDRATESKADTLQ